MSDPISELRHRLLELGCPPAPLRRIAREVAEHRDDLLHAALATGLDPAAAQARADTELGDPLTLAEQHIAVLRQSSWCGRHPVLAFGLLPFFAVPVLWVLWMLLCIESTALLLGDSGNQHAFGQTFSNPHHFPWFVLAFNLASQAGLALEALLFCWLARRFALGTRWMFIACSLATLHALFMYVRLVPHHLTVGYGLYFHHWLHPLLSNLLPALIPLFVAILVFATQHRAIVGLDAAAGPPSEIE